MKAHIVLAHPEGKSFNARLARETQQSLSAAGWQTTLSDLYAMDFDPREGAWHFTSRKETDRFHAQTEQRHSVDTDSIPPDVQTEIDHILESDLLVVHFPLWWFGPPAILKGWMDRVFVYGRLYRSAMRYDKGICAGKRMIACVTTGASEDNCAYNGREGDTKLHLWPILFPFRYLGFEVYEPEILHGIGGVAFMEGHSDGLSAVDAFANRWINTLGTLSSRPIIPYNRDSDFDASKRLVPDAPVYSPFVRHKNDLTLD